MKNSLQFLVLAGFALCAFLFTSCSKDEKKEAPVIGTYSVGEQSYDIKYAYFTQDGDKYMFGLSNSNSLNTNNKDWLILVIPEAKFNTDIEFNGLADSDFATFAISIDGNMYGGQNNELGDITSGNMKIVKKANNTFNIVIDMMIDSKEVECNFEAAFTKIPFELVSGFLPS